MKLQTQPYKGARDFYPEDMALQNYIFATWKQTVQSFGYLEYNAPIIEPIELYLAKTSEEIVNEQTYSFVDRGGRKVTLRPEMTPTVSRMVAARRQELTYPLRLFSMPNVWRYERPQKGRLREHWQLNVDLFGVETVDADLEIIQIASALMASFGATTDQFKIRINSRKLVNYILGDYCAIPSQLVTPIVRHIDHINKMPAATFRQKLNEILDTQALSVATDKLIDLLAITDFNKLPVEVKNHQSASDIKALMLALAAGGITNAMFDISLMRGFDYYTDIVFEVIDTDPANNRSMFGGGRYDGLVASFGVEPLPTVGMGMGDVTIQDFIQTHGLMPKITNSVDAIAVFLGDVNQQANQQVTALRQMGVKVAVDFSVKKLDKKIRNITKSGVKFAIFIGEAELAAGCLKLKNLSTGQEKVLSVTEVAHAING